MQRFEALKVILHGNAEFEAKDVVIQVSLVVPELISYGWRDQILFSKFFFLDSRSYKIIIVVKKKKKGISLLNFCDSPRLYKKKPQRLIWVKAKL